MVYLGFLALFLAVYCLTLGLIVSTFNLDKQLPFLKFDSYGSPTEFILSQVSVWYTWLIVGVLATICALVYLNSRYANQAKQIEPKQRLKQKQKSKPTHNLDALAKELNDLIDNLSEIDYEVGSDFEYVFDEVLAELAELLDEDNRFITGVKPKQLKRLIKQFNEVAEYDRESKE